MSISHIINLLEFCLNSTSFVYQGQFYQQLEGAAMGSPLSPIVANIFMENVEEEALATTFCSFPDVHYLSFSSGIDLNF